MDTEIRIFLSIEKHSKYSMIVPTNLITFIDAECYLFSPIFEYEVIVFFYYCSL